MAAGVVALLAPVPGPAAAQAPVALEAIEGRLSPDGLTVAVRARDGASVRLLVVEPYDTAAAPRWLSPPGADVDAVAWSPDGGSLVYRSRSDGHLHVVPADGAAPPADLTPAAPSPTRLAGFAPDGAALVEIAAVPGAFPDLYRIALQGGQASLVRASAAGVVRWIVDEAGSVRLAVRELEAGDREIVRLRDGVLSPVFACSGGSACEPVGFHPDGRVWLVSSEGRDAPALLLLDPLTMRAEVARTTLGIDGGGVFREDSTYASAVTRLATLLPGAELELGSELQGAGGRLLIAAREASGSALYVFDRWVGAVTRVLSLAAGGGSGAITPNTALAWPAELRYRVSDGDPGMPATEVTRRIRRTTQGGSAVIVVLDEAEVPVFAEFELDTTLLQDPSFDPDLAFSFDDMSMEDASDEVVLDAATLRPIRREASGPLDMEIEFGEDGVRGEMSIGGFDSAVSGNVPSAGTPLWTDGASLELLVAALPLVEGYAAELTWFDTGARTLVTADLAVRGATRADVEAGSFDAWTVTLTPRGGEAASQTWLVRRSAPHIVLRSTLRTRDFTREIELVEGVTP